MIPFSPQKSWSHTLILMSIVVACIGLYFPNFLSVFWLHSLPLYGDIVTIFWQILLFQFLHWSFLHLLLNVYFLYFVWPEVEARMKSNQFLQFFIFTTLVVAVSLMIFTKNTVTVGISGFCMALLSYICIDLWNLRHHRANEFSWLLVINIATGIFIPNISFVGHLVGAICWIIWWFFMKKFPHIKK